jgi:hypothetical protein
MNRLAGTLMDLSSVTSVRIGVQGVGPIDPFVNWESIVLPKPLLEASNVRACCLQAAGRLEGLSARAAALASPSIDPDLLHPLVWAAALRLWNDGHRRLAVAPAAEAVTGQMKQLTGARTRRTRRSGSRPSRRTNPNPVSRRSAGQATRLIKT